MDWLRRNWPDLLIGIALVAVIAGIIATLITGGSFFPVGQSTQTSTPPAQSSTTQSSAQPATSSPSTSSTTSTPSSGNATSGSAASGSSQASSGGANASGGSASNGTASNGTASTSSASNAGNGGSSASSGGVAVLPPSGGSSSSASSSGNAGSASSGGASSGSAASGSTTTANAAPPASSGASATGSSAPASSASAGNGPGSAAPYRISVGAFSHPDYAKRREQVFKQAGYPAFLASQGDLTIVLVGPYRTQSEADSVASKIKNGGFGVDPVVYEFKGTQDSAPPPANASAGGSAASSSASGGSSSSGTSSSGTSSSTSSASAPAGQHYLQVGAYGTAASAKPQRDRLTSMGYQVTERNEGGLVKLLIGPFGPSKLQQVESQLKAAGIDSFPR